MRSDRAARRTPLSRSASGAPPQPTSDRLGLGFSRADTLKSARIVSSKLFQDSLRIEFQYTLDSAKQTSAVLHVVAQDRPIRAVYAADRGFDKLDQIYSCDFLFDNMLTIGDALEISLVFTIVEARSCK